MNLPMFTVTTKHRHTRIDSEKEIPFYCISWVQRGKNAAGTIRVAKQGSKTNLADLFTKVMTSIRRSLLLDKSKI